MGIFTEENLKNIKLAEQDIVKRTILIVDDEEHNLKTLKDTLIDHYHILTASDGQKALELLQKEADPHRIHLIISDQRMPRMTGVEFLQHSIEIVPRSIRIILTGYTDVDAIIDSINQARIFKFILKPFDKQDILLTIRRGLELYDLEEKNHKLIKALEFLNGRFFNHMRGILQGMAGANEWIQEEKTDQLSPQQNKMLMHLDASTTNLIDLLNQASELSFIYTGHLSTRPEQLDVIALIKEIGTAFLENKSADELTIRYEWLLKEYFGNKEEFYLEVDREMLSKTLMELLENAFNYADKPTVITLVSLVQNNQFHIQVRDQGIGLENEGGQTVMEPFLRGPQSYDYQSFGLGVGLAKAQAYMELQGGTLGFKQETTGSMVILSFPLFQFDPEQDILIEEVPRKILLLQENHEDLQLYQEVLNFEGHDVFALEHPDGLIDAISEWKPDLIFLDAHYQGQSTTLYVQKTRETFVDASIPIVILANDPDLTHQQTYLDCGAQIYTSKPMEYDRLMMLIQQL